MVTVCCVGVGRWGQNIARVLTTLRDKGEIYELIICDKNLKRAKFIAEKHGIEKVYNDIDKLVKMENVDAFIIAVPTKYHYEVAMKLVHYGDLFIEKPIASNVKEAQEIINACRSESRILMIGHIVRYEPATRYLLYELLPKLRSEGDEVVHISAERVGPGPFNPTYTLNLGVSHDLLVHDIDLSLIHI